MKKLLTILMMLFVFTAVTNAALTKTSSVVDVWAEVAEDDMREGAATDISDSYSTTVTVDAAVSAADAGEGCYIMVQVSASTSGDLDWVTLPGAKVLVLVGTANLETITNNPAAIGTTVFTCASTTGYEVAGSQYMWIEDTVDVTKSEIMLQKSHVASTSITALDGSTNSHTNASVLSNLAVRKVFSIPLSFSRVRVILDNTFDNDATAPTIHSAVSVNKVTSLN